MRVIVTNSNPSIIAITEFKPKNARFNIDEAEVALPAYDMFYNSLNQDGTRGCILYIKKDLCPTQVELESPLKDHVWCSIKLINNDSLLVGCIYRSPNCDRDKSEDLNKLLCKASDFKATHKLLMGDFNFPNIDWSTWSTLNGHLDEQGNTFLETIRDCFYYQNVQKSTRARGRDNPHVLDLIFTNEEDMLSDLEYHSPLGKSDHCCMHFKFNCYMLSRKSKDRYMYDKGNYEHFRNAMAIDWSMELEQHVTVSAKWNYFKNKLLEEEKKFIPVFKAKNVSNIARKSPYPLEHKILAKIKKKHRAWQRYMETRDGVKYQEYCRLRNQVRSLTRKAQANLEKSVADEAKSNPKKFWSFTKSKTKTRPGIPELETINPLGNTIKAESDKDKADMLKTFFSSVLTLEPPGPLPHLDERVVDNILQNIEITEELVFKKLSNLKQSKSPGPDGLHPRVLKELKAEVAKPLELIFNASLHSGEIPQDWRIANISPIFKKGKKNNPGNYRPVSLTSVSCKIMETFVRDAVYDHMKTNNLFTDKQFGFIRGRSTTTQLISALEEWTSILDERGNLDVIYMDFMKAFDKVPHNRLLHKLENYGIGGMVGNWVRSFLAGRRHRVVVNGNMSSWDDVSSGVPQGSVLGPILFVLYINDLPNVISPDTGIYLFADDTKLYRQIRSVLDHQILQRDLNNLLEWSEKWLLIFHPGKCKVLEIGAAENYNYILDGQSLEHVKSEKDVGIVIDQQLKFDLHILQKVNKANSIMGIIRRSFKYLTADMFVMLFKALVRPHLEYANTVWSPHLKKDLILLENVQRRATKQVPGLRDMSYQDRLRHLNLPSLVYRRARGDMIETYKFTSDIYDPVISDILPLHKANVEGHNLRGHSKKLFKKRARLNIRKHFYSQRVVDTWNSLPQKVIEAPSVKSFERRLDRCWKSQAIKYDFDASLTLTVGELSGITDEDLDIEV